MDYADLVIEGAGLALVGTIVAGLLAIAGQRRRLLMGITLGMGLALLTLPFVAYAAAWLTHHRATDVDLTPPAYIVATALVCAGISVAGALAGGLAELRRPAATPAHPRKPGPEDDGVDDPHAWFPWGQPGWRRKDRL